MSKLCLSCEITTGRQSVPGGAIYESELYHAHQDVAYPIPGQIILATKRHFNLLTEMNSDEVSEFIPLVQRLRAIQQNVLEIDHAYYFYNEDSKHHFHLWMVPRYDWMSQFGKSIESVRPALLHARETMNTDENLQRVSETAARMRQILQA